ncbi:MAG: Osmosensitive channel, histidine kinase sensor [Candidatus Angelobacter sp.]|nr:Osmosensitive channel, histidine kinase sensor [Candidatus Angelobacter sp.]
MPKTPEQWLEQAAPEKTAGIFKVFLGYAPGVGKTYSMLSEAIRRSKRDEDVVIGVAETHGRKGVAELIAQLPVLPRRQLEYKGTKFEEMDVDSIIARKPQVVLVDELAHTNVEGSKHKKRYEDVLEILAAKIDVLSTMNIQHLESVSPTVQSITGIKIRETVPDWVLERANEVVLADLTPEALQTRMRRGDIYPLERAEQALTNFFRAGNLLALRELALRHVTHSVDRSLESYLQRKRIDQNWGVSERVAVCISSNPASQQLIARGARMAHGLDAEFLVIHVETGKARTGDRTRSLQANINFAENLGARTIQLKGKIVATTVAEFVREHKITQVIFGRSAVHGWRKYLYLAAMNRFLANAPSVDVHIVNQEEN